MKVLIACEFSGVVREAFHQLGHDAWSCDLLETECQGQHILEDVSTHLEGWDLIIAHPPCTYLSIAGTAWWNKPGRAELRKQAASFFLGLYNAPCPKVCIENPVGYMNTHFRKPDQIINPFQFGHHERKRTCLWLRGLPLLQPTLLVQPEAPTCIDYTGKKRYSVDKLSPSKDRWKLRSRTYKGIAEAMAQQWGH
jgi:hypothetical protein